MFGLSIVKTADLNNLKLRVADLEQDLDPALDKLRALQAKYDNLTDQVQRSDTATREQLSVLAKTKTCPVLQRTHKHVTDPVGAWESKQRVLEQRLQYATLKATTYHRSMCEAVLPQLIRSYRDLTYQAQEQVQALKVEIYEHQKCKPDLNKDKAVIVRHKKYGTLGLLKGEHITILSKGNSLDVGDVILNITPDELVKFWITLPQFDTFLFVL